MVSIDDLREEIKKQEELKETQNDILQKTPYEKSLLYYRDVKNSLNLLKKVHNECDIVCNDIKTLSNDFEKATSTIVNKSSNGVLLLNNLLQTCDKELDIVVNDQIMKASLDVWTEKKTEFETNYDEANKNINNFRTNEKLFDEANNSYNTAQTGYKVAKSNFDRTSSLEPQKKRRYKDNMNNYEKEMKKYNDEMERCARLCHHHLVQVRNQTIKNKDLLNNYLKNYN